MHKSDDRVTGEILIQSVTDEGKPINIMPQTSFNFSAVRTRKEHVTNLAMKYPKLPWGEMIDQLCYAVQERARRGEPVLELWTSEENIKPPEPLLEPILYKGLPTVIFGDKGVAKSTLALGLYFCLLLPWTANPLGLKAPDRCIQTLILDWETEGDIVQFYGKLIQEGHNLPAVPILYRRCGLPLADDLEQIQNHIMATKAEAIIIDSLGAAAGGELNKPEVALAFFTALRQLKVGSLIIAQNSKDMETKKKSIYGSTYFSYYARNIFELCKAETIDENDIDIALFHRSINIGKPQRPMSFRLHYNETGLRFERQPFDIAEFMIKVSNSTKVLEALKHGALPVEELAKACGIERSAAQVALTRLKAKGQILQTEWGTWGLKVRNNIS